MKHKVAILSILIVICAIIGSLAFVQVQKAKVAATHSTAASLCAALQSQNMLNISATNWQILGDVEYDRTVTEVSRKGSIDVGRNGWKSGGVLVDSWGNRLQIAVRKSDQGKLEYIVWSKGADGISKTSDDVVVPHSIMLP